MPKDQTAAGPSNRKVVSVANSVLKDPVSGPPVIAIDIAHAGTNFVRSSTAANLDAAEAAAQALALSSGKPTRVTINGSEYQVYSRGQG